MVLHILFNKFFEQPLTYAVVTALIIFIGKLFSQGKKALQQLKQYSYIEPGQKPREGHGEVHSSAVHPKSFVLAPPDEEDVVSVYHSFERAVEKYPDNNCLGTRIDGKYKWLSYRQVHERMTNFGSGLVKVAGQEIFVGLFSNNRAEWCIAEKACNAYHCVSIPLYDTLGHEAIHHIITHTQLTTIVCSKEHSAKVIALSKECETLKFIIQMEELEENEKAQAHEAGVTFLSMSEVEKLGANNRLQHIPPKASDICTICFTSGTTGVPKGAMVTHQNLIADFAAAKFVGLDITFTDVHISYLPLAHMFERLVQVCLFHQGAACGFFQGDILKLFSDINELQPTLFCSVPRLFNRLYDKVLAGVAASSPIKRKLFHMALASKVEGLKYGKLTHFLWDILVFKKIRASLGGRVRLMVTGSAPISDDVMNFLRVGFSCPVLEGYGMTETTAAATLTFPSDFTTGHVGGPLPCNQIKLVSVPEMNYLVTDKPYPRGEVCFKGANIFAGYYKDEEKTREAYPDGDGWLYSGDVGCWLPGGKLKIIDRKKNIFKLAQGEYVAPDKIENVYIKSAFVAQCFVYGDSLQHCLVAVVVPDSAVLMPWATQQGLNDDFAGLCKNAAVQKMILDDIKAVSKQYGLKGFEVVQKIHLEDQPFSVENNLLTPTFKPKRQDMKQHYLKQIEAMYGK